MQDNNSTDNIILFRKALREMFKGAHGETVIKFLQEFYVESPAVDENPHLAYYKLGQKEFVQGLIKDATSDIEEIQNLTHGG